MLGGQAGAETTEKAALTGGAAITARVAARGFATTARLGGATAGGLSSTTARRLSGASASRFAARIAAAGLAGLDPVAQPA